MTGMEGDAGLEALAGCERRGERRRAPGRMIGREKGEGREREGQRVCV
jgi:hypothetical protein